MYVVYNFSLALPNAAGKRKTAVAGGLKVYKEKGGYEMRSKIAKKLLATSVLTAMTIGLVGCGDDAVTNEQPTQAPANDDPKPTEAPVTPSTDEKEPEAPVEDEPEVSPYTVKTDANGNAYDLGGMEVTIRDWWSPGDGLVEEAMNAYDEERLAFYDWMQETYNFTLVRKGISDWGSTPADFLEYATTGGDDNNYVFMQRACTDFTQAVYSGLLYDLATLDCLDFSEEKWGAKVHEAYTLGDSIYAMAAEGAEPRQCLYFNKQVLKDAGIDPESLYDLQENMQWTWDKFEELLAQVTRDLDNDGINDVWGYVGQREETFTNIVYSNGGEFIGQENGKFVYKLGDQATLDGLRKAAEWNSKYYYFPEGAAWDYFVPAFAAGNIAFFIDQAYRGQDQLAAAQAEGAQFDWGVMCMPMGPNATDYTNIYANNIAAIPAIYDAQRAWNIAFAYDCWYDPVPGYEDYEGWKSAYMKGYKDTESIDLTLARLKKNGRITFHDNVPNINLASDFLWKFGAAPSPDELSACEEAVREAWKSYIDEANNK